MKVGKSEHTDSLDYRDNIEITTTNPIQSNPWMNPIHVQLWVRRGACWHETGNTVWSYMAGDVP